MLTSQWHILQNAKVSPHEDLTQQKNMEEAVRDTSLCGYQYYQRKLKKQYYLLSYTLKLISVFNSILLFAFNTFFFAFFVTVTASTTFVHFQTIGWV